MHKIGNGEICCKRSLTWFYILCSISVYCESKSLVQPQFRCNALIRRFFSTTKLFQLHETGYSYSFQRRNLPFRIKLQHFSGVPRSLGFLLGSLPLSRSSEPSYLKLGSVTESILFLNFKIKTGLNCLSVQVHVLLKSWYLILYGLKRFLNFRFSFRAKNSVSSIGS